MNFNIKGYKVIQPELNVDEVESTIKILENYKNSCPFDEEISAVNELIRQLLVLTSTHALNLETLTLYKISLKDEVKKIKKKCKDCDCAIRGYFKSVPEAYICIGTKEPFIIDDYINTKCKL